MNFRRIKKNYDNNLWDKGMVKVAVTKGVISEREYFLITGETYDSISQKMQNNSN